MRLGKTSILACVFPLVVALPGLEPGATTQGSEADKAAINKVLHDQEIAWNKGDVDDFMR
jgi:hypothetical protein